VVWCAKLKLSSAGFVFGLSHANSNVDNVRHVGGGADGVVMVMGARDCTGTCRYTQNRLMGKKIESMTPGVPGALPSTSHTHPYL
jgi:hypothetical protein